jgi:hypothetical protein
MLMPGLLLAQLAFTNATPLMSASTSGGCMGVVDMNGDGRDDIAKLQNARTLVVDYQNADGTFTTVTYGNMSNSGQWGWAIADVDNNGHKDAVSGGNYDGTHYFRINSVGNGTLSNLNGGTIFTQGMSIGDMDNDGRVDVYACHDDGPPSLWFTNASGVPVNNNAYINWATPCNGSPAGNSGDMSGNYGSNFVDFDNDGDQDLYIAHCRQGVTDQADCRRWNRLFVNDGTNHYSDLAASYGVQIRYQTWTTDFGDIDNDGDFDMVATNHDFTMQLFENDGTGHFTEITNGSGVQYNGTFLQSKFADFDNDGFVDILVSGMDVEYFFRNNGNKTFSRINNLFPSNKLMHGFATGDLNNDGFTDVFANYGSSYITPDNANPDRLWLNNGNGNHWFGVRLQGTVSNRDAVGARVTIQGPWGTQIREVRAGESYGMVCSFAALFGLGESTVIPTLTVRWPSGLVETFTNLTADRYITIIEGTCISPTATINTVGAAALCGTGSSVTLSANAGFGYTWSTGATSQQISVSTPGNYAVTINDGNGCTASTSIFVAQSPDETPTVSVNGPTTFCQGGSLVLSSTPAASYSWSSGGNGQNLTVTASGTYSVTIEGACAQFTSAPVTVTVLAAPPPTTEGASINGPGTAMLMATGSNINWYDAPVGGNLVGTGNTFNTPYLTASTTYYASAISQYGNGNWYGGPQSRLQTAAPGAYHTNVDNYLYFTASEAFTIVSVKVYANGAGARTIALIDRSNGATLASQAIDIADGESRITLNFAVPGAGNYGLRAVGGNPQLWRDGLGSNPTYPYALGTVGAITSSSVSGANATAYYYFFYDWEVATAGVSCESVRVPAEVQVGIQAIDEAQEAVIAVFPNPAADNLTVNLGRLAGVNNVELLDVTGRVAMAFAPAQQQRTLSIGVSGVARGEYALRVRHADGVVLKRVVLR